MKRTSFSTRFRPALMPAMLLTALALLGCSGQNRGASVSSSATSSQTLPKKSEERKQARKSLFQQSVEQYTEARKILDRARSLRCQFPRGSHVDLADPVLRRQESAGAEVTFDAIDRQRGRARIIAESGASDVTVISGPTALTFVEVAETGNPFVTVVFPRFRDGTREFFAADSEHIYALGDVSVGQYYGSCTVLE